MIDCNWDTPGNAPYRAFGGLHISKALDNYGFTDIAKQVLLSKIVSMQNDATIFITKNDIISAFGTAANLRDMHFKNGMCAGTVSRNKWKDTDTQPALVYCHETDCVAIPVVCENISRVDYFPLKRDSVVPSSIPNRVPEPGTIWLVLAAVLGYLKFKLDSVS